MDDKRKFTPDLATVLRESDKKALDDKLNRALENPALDAAIAKVKPKLQPGEDPLFYDVNRRLSSTSVTPTPAPALEGAAAGDGGGESLTDAGAEASPWVRPAAHSAIDQAALPSALLPPSTPPTSLPIPDELRRGASARPAFPRRRALALALAALGAPLLIVLVHGRMVSTRSAPPGASVAATAQGPNASAVSATASPSGDAPPPAVTPEASADAAPPPATGQPRPPPSSTPRPAPAAPKVGPSAEPRDTAPPAPSLAPTAPLPPPVPPPQPSPSSPKATPIF